MDGSRAAVVIVVSTLMCGAALAHHGWGSYDASKMFKIDSRVESLNWQNPHVEIEIPHDGATWRVVLAPPFRMGARGLSPEMIGTGVHIVAEGYPSTRVPNEMRAERMTVNGTVFELR